MTSPVKLSDLTAALELPQEWSAWLDLKTGRVITLDPETRAAGEEEAEGPAWVSDEDIAVAKAIAGGDARYLALPDQFDFHEYRHMERFVGGVNDGRISEQLWHAIKGKGAFRHFKATAARLGLLDDWFEYRQRALEQHMLDWAAEKGIAVEPAPRKPGI